MCNSENTCCKKGNTSKALLCWYFYWNKGTWRKIKVFENQFESKCNWTRTHRLRNGLIGWLKYLISKCIWQKGAKFVKISNLYISILFSLCGVLAYFLVRLILSLWFTWFSSRGMWYLITTLQFILTSVVSEKWTSQSGHTFSEGWSIPPANKRNEMHEHFSGPILSRFKNF